MVGEISFDHREALRSAASSVFISGEQIPGELVPPIDLTRATEGRLGTKPRLREAFVDALAAGNLTEATESALDLSETVETDGCRDE